MTPEQRARKIEAEGPDIYRGVPIMTRGAEDATCVDEFERAHGLDVERRFEPWVLP